MSVYGFKCCRVQVVWFCLVFALIPTAASANIVFPSVVQWLSAAGPYSLFILPAVFTLPLLFAISAIEAAIVRVVCKPVAGWFRLIIILFAINAVTSTIGLFTMPNGTELFPGIPLAYLGTTILEAFGILLLFPKGKRRLSLLTIKASALMNWASYAFLAALLTALIYLPSARMRNDLDIKELSGRIVVLDYNSKPKAVVELPSGEISMVFSAGIDQPKPKYKIAHTGKERWIVNTSTGERTGKIPAGSYDDGWQISDNGRFYTNHLADSDTVVVGDVVKGTRRSFQDIDAVTMHAGTGKTALNKGKRVLIYDPTGGAVRTLKLDGAPRWFGHIVWSPDGKYLAYFANLSPFTQMVGEQHFDAVRAVSLTGRSVTVVQDHQRLGHWSELVWLGE